MDAERRLVARYAVSFDRMAMDNAGKLQKLLRDHEAFGHEVVTHSDHARNVQVYEVYERVAATAVSWDEQGTTTLDKVMQEVAALKRAGVKVTPGQVQSAIVHPSLLSQLRDSLRARGIEPKDWPEDD